MNCEILETFYVKSNGEIPCNDDAGEQVILGRIDETNPNWSISTLFENKEYSQIRSAFPEGNLPWPNVCENCAFLRRGEAFSDSLRVKRIRKIQLEPSLACNLRCPCCCNSIQIRSRNKPHIMRLETLETLLRSLTRESYSVAEVEYCGQGEPLMHPDFTDVAACVRRYLPQTRQRLITNGNFSYAETVRGEYLDEIFVSCDGVFQGNYEQYRVRGEVEKPLQFMRDVPSHVDGKKQFLIWKYILFEFNDSDEELIAAQEAAQDLGVDTLLFVFTHSRFRSTKYLPETAVHLPILYPNVVTNMTPIMFNREISFAALQSPKRRWFARRPAAENFRCVVDEVALIRGRYVNIRGWALSREKIASLEITLDDEVLGRARMSLPRQDVYQAFPDFENRQSGFAFAAELPAPAKKKHRLFIKAHLEDAGVREHVYDIEFLG